MPSIADLFVNLGVKGADKSVGEITKLRAGIKEVSSQSLEAKAAILGVMYTLERLFATSNQRGTSLLNLDRLLGGGLTQTVQRYQWAAQQVGISNEEMASTFLALQDTATKATTGQGTPGSIGRVATLLGMRDNEMSAIMERVSRTGHSEELVQLLQRYVAAENDTAHGGRGAGVARQNAAMFGVGQNVVSGMEAKAFNPDVLARAPTYSEGGLRQLDQNRKAWANLATTIEMAVGKFNISHGGELVKGISDLVPKVLALANAFVKLGEHIDVFKLIGMIFKGWEEIFDGLSETVENIVTIIDTISKNGASSLIEGATDGKITAKGIASAADTASNIASKAGDFASSFLEALGNSVHQSDLLAAGAINNALKPAPALSPNVFPGRNDGARPNVTVNQNLNFQHDGKNAKQTGDSVRQAAKSVYLQSPAGSKGN